MSVEAIDRWLADRAGAMEQSLAELVDINSYTDNPEGGRQVGVRLRELFQIPLLQSRMTPSTRYADHLAWCSEGRADLPPVALVGHLDTVFPPGTFEGFRRDGALARGPGVFDMKGGIVIMAYALRALAENVGLASTVPLRVVLVADEEVGSPEGQGVIRDEVRGVAACLVFEAGRKADAIVTARKGTGSVTVTARGKAAHAGNNHAAGVNAIWALARVVDGAQRLTNYDRGVTVNVGRIQGGQSKNTVPDAAEASIDIRFTTRADGEWLVQSIHDACAEASSVVTGASFEVRGGMARPPLERSEASVTLMQEYAACARAVGLGGEEAPLMGGGSDANTTSALGIPSIDGLGPRGSGFHTHDEQIEVASLVPKAQALARFLLARSQARSS